MHLDAFRGRDDL
jgi:hypothetical protein